MKINEQRWDHLCVALGLASDRNEFNRLASAYSESHRAYHTLQHLSECMEKLDWAAHEHRLQNRALAEAALWYHDAVYRPRSSDNELKSAAWACDFLGNAGLSPKDCKFVHSLIMATCHGEKPKEYTHQFVVDIDLSILGAEAWRFAEYEQQVRREYRWVPWFLYKKKRRELLQHFLREPHIFNTELFYTYFERRARENLQQSITRLNQ